MIVVDASTMTHVLAVEEADGPAHRRLAAEDELHAPHLIDLEVAAALRGLVLGRHLSPQDAKTCLADYLALALARYAHEGLLSRVWDLRHNLTPYDAAYVALAELLGAVLVTGDSALATAAGVHCPVEVVG